MNDDPSLIYSEPRGDMEVTRTYDERIVFDISRRVRNVPVGYVSLHRVEAVKLRDALTAWLNEPPPPRGAEEQQPCACGHSRALHDTPSGGCKFDHDIADYCYCQKFNPQPQDEEVLRSESATTNDRGSTDVTPRGGASRDQHADVEAGMAEFRKFLAMYETVNEMARGGSMPSTLAAEQLMDFVRSLLTALHDARAENERLKNENYRLSRSGNPLAEPSDIDRELERHFQSGEISGGVVGRRFVRMLAERATTPAGDDVLVVPDDVIRVDFWRTYKSDPWKCRVIRPPFSNDLRYDPRRHAIPSRGATLAKALHAALLARGTT